MTHIRINHPTRPTLDFKQSVQDDYQRQAVADITQQLGTGDPPLVHTRTRNNRRSIRGSVSAPKQARDTNESDWQTALADYVDQLESHVDEFQGVPGYTLEDDQLNITKTGILESIEWSMTPGRIYEVDYSAEFTVGRGTMESQAIQRRNPTPDTSMSVMLRVDGVDCPGMLDYRASRQIGVDVVPIFNRTSAENNDIVVNEGYRQTIEFEGVHSGTLQERRNADTALSDLEATKDNITLETQFPGYNLDGFVLGYNSTFENRRGGESHRYRLEFTEGTST